ncbi:MAG: hypothetical protein IJX65_09270 [Alistipes sp.]|nr:hypothetical protein [Alistipes sp.]
MKRLFTFIALAAITFSLSAQTKVAYCDVYVRGGGQNLRVTVMYDHNVNYYDRTNMGNILNAFAADGWALDSEIVIPRFHWWSWCTRHKLHLIMKKEYQTGENPFKNLKSLNLSRTSTSMDDSYNQNKSTYGFSTSQKKDNNLSLYGVYDGYSVIVELSQDGKHGKAIRTYDYAASYKSTLRKCQELGDSWRLPTEDELILLVR